MKRIALKNEKKWEFELSGPLVYFNDQTIYPEVQELNLSHLPDYIFSFEKLESLHLDKSPKVTVIGDDIKNLIKLKEYWHWQAEYTYISPELFRLSHLEDLNFYQTSFKNPPKEIYEDITDLKRTMPKLSFHEQCSWFRGIWSEV